METASNEADLVERAKSGDVAAFETLYRMHSNRVYGLCIRLTASRAEAEDCTQETFIRAWRRLPDFRGESRLTTWLHTIAYREVTGRKRQATREAGHLVSVGEESRAPEGPDQSEQHDLEAAISRLPARAREAIVLQKVYGYTHAEAAEIMGITAGACKAQVHRAMKLLAMTLPVEEAAGEQTRRVTTE